MAAGADADVVVVGAGLAGAAAAAKLVASGAKVIVAEARDRLGGRGFVRPFAGDSELIDFGGSWITPWQSRIRALCNEHDVVLRPRAAFIERRWLRDGALHRDGPTDASERLRHERAIARIAADSTLIKLGHAHDEKGRPIAQIVLNDYLDRLGAPKATRDLLSAWWAVSGNADKTRVPAAELLSSSSYGEGLSEAMADVWIESLQGGVPLLVSRMLREANADIMLNAAVAAIRHRPGHVGLDFADGRSLKARAAILATGLNPLRQIAFAPRLGEAKTHAIATGHIGRAVKVWVKARNVEVGVLATGGGSGIEWMFSERRANDGATMIVGFGVAANGWAPALPGDAISAAQRFFPEAQILAADWHDWNSDAWSLGTWLGPIAGQDDVYDYKTWMREGSLAFASSDIAPEQAGWFEAAIISGEAAAAEIVGQLQGTSP
jgi:monoamine oxidase